MRNIFWATLGKVIHVFGALIVAIFVARYLGPEQYGLMNYIISYVSLFTIIATFGLDNIEIRELSKYPEQKEKILGTAFRIRISLAFIALLVISITLHLFEADKFTSAMILVYSSTLLVNTVYVIRNYFTSIILNKYVVKSEILKTMVGLLIKVFLLYIQASLVWFIIATAFDAFIVTGGYIIAYKKKVGKISSWTFHYPLSKHLLVESFPLMLSGTAVIIYQKIDQVMIKNMIDSTSVGLFSAAAKISDVILFVPSIITQTITPLLVRLKKENTIRYEQKKQQFINIVVWLSIFLALIVSISSGHLISISFGSEYMASAAVLQIMAWKTVGMAMSSSSGQIIIIEGIQRFAVIRNIIGSIICISLNLALIPVFGIIGSAWTSIATVFISGYIANYLIKPYRNIFISQTKALISLFSLNDVLKH